MDSVRKMSEYVKEANEEEVFINAEDTVDNAIQVGIDAQRLRLTEYVNSRIEELQDMYSEDEVSRKAPSPPPAHRVDELEKLLSELIED